MESTTPSIPGIGLAQVRSGHSMVAGMFFERTAAEQAVAELQAAGFYDYQLDTLAGSDGRPERVLLTVVTGGQAERTLAIIGRNGGDTSSSERAPIEPDQEKTDGRQRIALMAEELHVHKQKVKTGEVRIRKETITETRLIEVSVTREELVIEQRLFRGGDGKSDPAFDEIRIPLMEEQVTIEKRPVVFEEVFIGKREVQGSQQVSEDVRREILVDDSSTVQS